MTPGNGHNTDLDLIAAYLEGDLSERDLAEFNERLALDPAFADVFTAQAHLHTALRRAHAAEQKETGDRGRETSEPTPQLTYPIYRKGYEPKSKSAFGNRQLAILSAIAAAALLTAAIVVIYLIAITTDPQPDPVPPDQPGPAVATLIENTGDLRTPYGFAAEGNEYPSGVYALDRGHAQFVLTNRVTVDMRGETQLRMNGDRSLYLSRGTADFNVPHDVSGFTVHLSDRARVVDLGTAFRVTVTDGNRARIRVTEGSVRIETTDHDGSERSVLMTEGEFAFVRSDDARDPVVNQGTSEQLHRVGAGADLPDATLSDKPEGDRLNVDRRSIRLAAGTYFIADWDVAIAHHTGGGKITPMLLTGKPGSYTTLWVGRAFDPTDNGVQTVPAIGRINLKKPTNVYAGFYTSRGGSAIVAHTDTGSTDHDRGFDRPSAPGAKVARFGHPNLKRTYAFGIQLIADAPAIGSTDQSRASAERPSVNSPSKRTSGSETADR